MQQFPVSMRQASLTAAAGLCKLLMRSRRDDIETMISSLVLPHLENLLMIEPPPIPNYVEHPPVSPSPAKAAGCRSVSAPPSKGRRACRTPSKVPQDCPSTSKEGLRGSGHPVRAMIDRFEATKIGDPVCEGSVSELLAAGGKVSVASTVECQSLALKSNDQSSNRARTAS